MFRFVGSARRAIRLIALERKYTAPQYRHAHHPTRRTVADRPAAGAYLVWGAYKLSFVAGCKIRVRLQPSRLS
jgi:hypothetical protein